MTSNWARIRQWRAVLSRLPVAASCARPVQAPAPQADAEPSVFLFSYFTRNGDDGLHLAYSDDGIKWLPLNGGRSVLRPAITGQGIGWMQWNTTASLMRDPCILRGPDGMFHLVWTISWTDRAIGVAHSRDLIHWTPQKRVPVMDQEPNALNAWAPELFYDDETGQYLIFWATSIPGRFPATDSVAQQTPRGRADHRLYYVTTRDFETFSPARLLYDGGFSAIDGTIKKSGDTYYLVMKDETFYPKPVRSLRVASSKHATGPYGPRPRHSPRRIPRARRSCVPVTGGASTTTGTHADATAPCARATSCTGNASPIRSTRRGAFGMDRRSSRRVRCSPGCSVSIVVKRAPTATALYRDATRPVAERVRDLLGRMTLEEKFWQLFMIPGDLDDPPTITRTACSAYRSRRRATRGDPAPRARGADQRHPALLRRATRLGIPIIPFEEAVHGLRATGATTFPQAIGLAATWDTSLMARVAPAIARETRSRGIRQVLSPVVNIANDRALGPGRGDVRRGSPALARAMARGVRRRVRARRRGRDAKAFRRQRRRRWARQLSDRLQRAAARRDVSIRRFAPRSARGTRDR